MLEHAGLVDTAIDPFEPTQATIPGTPTVIATEFGGSWDVGSDVCVQRTPAGHSIANLAINESTEAVSVYPYRPGEVLWSWEYTDAFQGDADYDAWYEIECIGDRDGDGFDEIAVASYLQSEARHPVFVSILNGTFDGVRYIDEGETVLATPELGALTASNLTSGDLDGDGRPEALFSLGGYLIEDEYFWANGGLGPDQKGVVSMEELDLYITPDPATPDAAHGTVSVGDVNGDGYVDLGSGKYYGEAVNRSFEILAGPLTGTHSWSEAIISLQPAADSEWGYLGQDSAPDAHDVDDDGSDDVVLVAHVPTEDWNYANASVLIYTGLSAGSYAVGDAANNIPIKNFCYEVSGGGFGLRVAEVDGDSSADLLVSVPYGDLWFPNGSVLIWTGPLASASERPTYFIGNAQPDNYGFDSLDVRTDLDGDGIADIVAGSGSASTQSEIEAGDGAIFIYESSVTPLLAFPD